VLLCEVVVLDGTCVALVIPQVVYICKDEGNGWLLVSIVELDPALVGVHVTVLAPGVYVLDVVDDYVSWGYNCFGCVPTVVAFNKDGFVGVRFPW